MFNSYLSCACGMQSTWWNNTPSFWICYGQTLFQLLYCIEDSEWPRVWPGIFMRVLETVMWKSGERTDVVPFLKRWSHSELVYRSLFFWRMVGRNLSEGSIYQQGWYSWQPRSRPKTWVCVLISHPYLPFRHLPTPRMSSPVSHGKNGFWIVCGLFRDI